MVPVLRKIIATCMLACVGAGGVIARSADDPAPAAPERMTVVFVGDGKISVKPGNGKDKTVQSTKYKVTDATTITINGEPGELSAIKPGHKVVIVPQADDAAVAASITLTKSGGQ